MKKSLLLIITIILTISIINTGCGNKPEAPKAQSSAGNQADEQLEVVTPKKDPDPYDVTAMYFEAFRDGRVSDVKALLSKESLPGVSDEALKSEGLGHAKTRKNFQILSVEIKDDTAKAKYLFATNDGGFEENNLYLVREDGKWKVDLKKK